MKVSIIMPAHNASRTIAEAINSVLEQTCKEWELLIIDDCSSDNTNEIAAEYTKKDPRIKLFQTDQSSGKPFYPRNIGIEKAAGQYIAFLDSDDLWLPTKLENQLPLFNENNVAIVFSYYEKFSSKQHFQKRIIKSPKTVNYNSALYGDPIGNLTGIYDTKKVGKIYFENTENEDYLMWLTILKKGFIANNTRSVEAKYRVSKNSISYNKLQSAKWTWKLYRKYLGLNLYKSILCFIIYAIKGIIKFVR